MSGPNSDMESQQVFLGNRKDEVGCQATNRCLIKTIVVFASLLAVTVVALSCTVGYIIEQNNSEFELPPLNYARFGLRIGAAQQVQSATMRGWKMTDRSGHAAIISGDDEYGVFTVEKDGYFYLEARITFNNKAPQNVATISVNGEDWEQEVHSSPLQHNKKGTVIDSITPCRASGYRHLKQGDKIAIGTGYPGRQASVLSKSTVFYVVEMR